MYCIGSDFQHNRILRISVVRQAVFAAIMWEEWDSGGAVLHGLSETRLLFSIKGCMEINCKWIINVFYGSSWHILSFLRCLSVPTFFPYFVFLLSIWTVLSIIQPYEYSNSEILISIRYISVFPSQRSTLSRTPTDIAALSLLHMTLVWIHLPLQVSKETDSECILYLFLSVYVFSFLYLLGC